MSDNLSSKPKTDIFAMASYSLYYGSLALVIAGCLVMVADLLYHHDVNNYRIIMPLNTLLLLCMATLVLLSARACRSYIVIPAVLLLLLVMPLVANNLVTLLPGLDQQGAIAAPPKLQLLYWLLFVLGWLWQSLAPQRVARPGFILSQTLLLLIALLVIVADTRLPVQLALNTTISTSVNTAVFMFFLAVAGLASPYAGKPHCSRLWHNPVSWLAVVLVALSVLLWLGFMHQLAAAKQRAFTDTAVKFEQQLSQLLNEQYGLMRRMAMRLYSSRQALTEQQLQLEMQSYLDDFGYIDYLAAINSQGQRQYSLAQDGAIKAWFDSNLQPQMALLLATGQPALTPAIKLYHDAAAEHTYIHAVVAQPNPAQLSGLIASINFNALLERILPVIVPPGYQVRLIYDTEPEAILASLDSQRRYVLEGIKDISLMPQLSWQLVLYRDLATEVSYARQISEVVLLAGWLATILALLGQQYQAQILRQHMRLVAGNMRLQHSLEAQKKLQLQHQQIMANSADMICVIDASGCFVEVSDACRWILGYSADELLGRPFLDFTHPEDKTFTEREAEQIVLAGKRVQNFRNRYLHKDGSVVHLMWVSNYVSDIGVMYAVARDINEMVKAEQYQQDQQAILRQILTEQPLGDIFTAICQMAERQSSTVQATIMLADADQLSLAAAPSFSEQYRSAMASLPVADKVGSCGTAAFQKSLVIVEDIAADEKWRDSAAIALAEGMQACWSLPMVSLQDAVLGTFALYCTEARAPHKDELELMINSCRLAAIALERRQQKQQLIQSEQRFRSLFESNPDPVYIINPQGYFIDMNQAGCQLLQYSRDEITAMHFDRVMLPEYLELTWQHFRRVLAGTAERFEASVISRSGQQVELDISILPSRQNGKVIGVIGVSKDISKRLAAERQLRLFKRAVDATSNGVIIADIVKPDMPVIYVNAAFEKLTGYSNAEVLGRNCRFLQGQQRDTVATAQIRQAIAARQECAVVLKNFRKDHSLFWNNLYLGPVPDERGEITHYIGIQTDITAQKQYQQELAYNASHDLLTGLPNRSLLRDRLTQSCNISRRHQQKVAILFIDLDGFKLINDSLGHLTGDELLKRLSRKIAGQIRPGDTLARLGGDEFVLLVPDVKQESLLQQLAERILTTIAGTLSVNEHEIQLTASIGISVSSAELSDPMQLVQQADLAMYRAKQLGRNNYQWYSNDMEQLLNKQLNLKTLLKKALENNEFLLYYQPQTDALSNQVVGLEALLRWPHPEQGFISPEEFIPVAEDTGLIVELGQWVLEQACAFNVALQQQGLAAIPVAVNLSSLQFQRTEFIDQLQHTLNSSGLAPCYLQLELTESLLLDNIEQVIDKLHQIKQLGVSIAIDDFGTGYSSLNYLKRLPIDKLKIDRAFVRDIVTDKRDAAICRAIIAMAHQLDVKVVAEGIENDAQAALLRKSLCDEFQGYYFALPMNATDTGQFLRQHALNSECQRRQAQAGNTLLLVDDEENILHALKRLLRKEPYTVLTCTSARQAFELLALHDVQVIVSDQRMPQMSGTEFLRQVKDMYPETIRLVLSGYTDLRSVTEAINQGAIYKFLTKPWQDDELREEIRAAFKRYAGQTQQQTDR